jgi:hypothetical protein
MKNAFLISLFILPVEIFCCSFALEPFCTTISKNSDNIIVYGTIISKDDDGLDFEVIEVLKGEENKTQIRIWDGLDFDCNGPFDMSVNTIGEINDTILISLPKLDTIVTPWDVIGDYSTPVPYGNTPKIFVTGSIATGYITSSIYNENSYSQTIEYEKLRDAIKSHGDCTDIELISNTSDPATQNKINIQNPASSTLSIRQSNVAEIVEVSLYSITGKKLITRKTIDQLEIAISIAHLPANLYVLQMINSDNTQHIMKLVKN